MPWTSPSAPSCPATGTDVVMEPSSFVVVVVALGLLSTVSVPLSTTGVAAGRAACATAACTCALDSNCRVSRVSKRREWTCFMPAPPALADRSDPCHRGTRTHRFHRTAAYADLSDFAGGMRAARPGIAVNQGVSRWPRASKTEVKIPCTLRRGNRHSSRQGEVARRPLLEPELSMPERVAWLNLLPGHCPFHPALCNSAGAEGNVDSLRCGKTEIGAVED